MNEQFGLLYAVPTFFEGVARSIDIGETLTEYVDSEDADLADTRALRSDWRAIGNDLRQVMTQYRKDRKDYSQTITHG